MANYTKALPKDITGSELQNSPAPIPALVSWQRENAVTSSVININPNTTIIEISPVGGQGLAIRWVPLTETAAVAPRGSVVASGLGANFDHIIPPATFRRFVIPRETIGAGLTQQAGSVNGLYQRLAWINAGSGATSILASEF